jgi:iron complex outermembrane receptor protein
MKKIMIIIATLLYLSTAQSETFTGQITDKGTPLSNITILIPSLNLKSETDNEGIFTFENISFDQYLLDIEKSNHSHFNTKIDFNSEETLNIDIFSFSYEEVVVTANPLEHNSMRMTTPTSILSEEELIINRSLSIDQTLNKTTGVNSGSFGAGAGQIVIRGQQGPRVSVLNNNIAIQDASSVSPDHWITSETLLAKQIEILKGPATLLYGGAAVGGVVNVVDNVIPTDRIDGIHGGIEARISDNTMNERSGVLNIEAGLSDNIMAHISYFNSETDDYEIPGFGESSILHASEGGDPNNSDRLDEEMGLLENTSVKSEGLNLGFSFITDNGYWGLSYSDFDRNYGIPGHGHEEEHEEGEDGHDEEEEEEEIVRIDLDKSVFNIKGRHEFSGDSFFSYFKTHFSQTDYQHIELEGDEIGTIFDNEANEFRFEIAHQTIAGFSGVWGLQFTNRDFSAIGDEAFILPSKTEVSSVFLIEEREFDNWHAEFGLRYDQQDIKTSLFGNNSDSAFSLSLGAAFDVSDNWVIPVNFTSAQRLPTAEELFSNQSGIDELIPHLATSTIEIGNPLLDHETANNIDIGLRFKNENFRFNIAFFYNKIDDYIFLQNSGENSEDFPIFNYQQQDATFKGYEIDLAYNFSDSYNNQWNYRIFTDKTDAKLNDNSNIPRIPANRFGADIGWLRGDWAANLDFVKVSSQNKVADLELPTEGYNALNMSINRIISSNKFETLIFFKANNLLDEEIREHASFIKDISPRPSRSFTVGARLTF